MKLLLTSLLLAGTLAGATPAQEPASPFALAYRAGGAGVTGPHNYLLPLQVLHQHRADYAAPEQAGAYWQALATEQAMIGEPDSAIFFWRRYAGASAAPKVQPATQPAAPFILTQTKQRQFVLFNEAHTQPKCRALVSQLLPALRKQGFRYLALEALEEGADSAGIRRRGYPVANSGTYTNEPTCANLLREAHRLGFKLVAYDTFGGDREQGQARNLLALRRADPQARVVVLAGHGHINERPQMDYKFMAQWLRELSGLDPLTIDQTQFDSYARHPVGRPPGAYVVIEPHRYLDAQAMQCDLYVINQLAIPPGNSVTLAPGQLTPVPVPPDSLAPGQAHVLLVYLQAETRAVPNPVPVAVRYLRTGELAPRFALRPATYTVALRDAPGQRRWQRTLLVR